ncbi:phage tail protein [Cohnella sp. GCM10012308]|uniref:phage tail-collar fiber domain-containing protein n=1 Tax=Cohnella sp. GCM10012308 TaxID=3317329 RepID=UPI003617826F
MAVFGGMTLTNKGLALQGKAQAGAELHYTKFAIGDGSLTGQAIPALNGLISQKQTLPIARLRIQPPNKAAVGTVISNADVTTGFYMREIGLFAQDPDVGEILYAYANAGVTADYIGPGGGPDIVEKTFDTVVTVGTAANITATIDGSLVFAKESDLILRAADGAVRVATTANITLSGLQTIDGVALAAGDRVLAKNQTTGSQNGIYVAAAGAWLRGADADTTAKVAAGISVYVREGTAGGGKTFAMSNTAAVTLGTTAITFVQTGGAGASTDTAIGSRTISDATAPTGDSGTVTTLFGWLANMIKSITGGATWRTAPVKSLAALNSEKANLSGSAFSGPVSAPSATVGSNVLQPANTQESLLLKGGSSNGVYMGFYPKAADQSSRGAYFGYVDAGSSDFKFHNQIDNGNLIFGVGGTGRIKIGTTTASHLEASGQIISTLPSGAAPFVVTSPTVVPNLNVDMVDGKHASVGNTTDTLVVRDSSSFINVSGVTLLAAQGTAPMVVTSTTVVANLNADTVDGFHGSDFVRANQADNYKTSTDLPSTYPNKTTTSFFVNNVSGWPAQYGTVVTIKGYNNMAATQYFYPYNVDAPIKYRYGLYSTDAWGSWRELIDSKGPSTTALVTNLNADLLDGFHASASNSSNTAVVRDANGGVSVGQATINAAQGTAPFVVTSTTVVTNLNADMVDGYHVSTVGTTNFSIPYRDGNAVISANRFNSLIASGTSPFVVASTTVVTNLNADMVDGFHLNQDVRTTARPTFAGADLTGGEVWLGAGNVNGPLTFSATPVFRYGASFVDDNGTGAAPFSVSSGGSTVTNLSADMVDGYHATDFVLSNSGGVIPNIVTTTGTATAYVATIPGITALSHGMLIRVNLHVPNGASPKLNVNGLGAKDIFVSGTFTLPANCLASVQYLYWDVNMNGFMVMSNNATSNAAAGTLMYRDTNGDTSARRFTSTVGTGTAPFTVTSTTAVANLNADMVDGYHVSAAGTANNIPLNNGTLMFTLNADMLDGKHATDFVPSAARTSFISLYVNASTGSDSNSGASTGTALKTIGAALALAKKNYGIMYTEVEIYVAAGTYAENIVIDASCGSRVFMLGAGDSTIINGTVSVSHIAYLSMGSMTIAATTAALTVAYVTYASVVSISIGTAASSPGIVITGGSRARVVDCTVSNRSIAIQGNLLSKFLSSGNGGTGNSTGLNATNGALIIKDSTQPAGTTAESASVGGRIGTTA